MNEAIFQTISFPIALYAMAWGIPFGLQSIIIPMGPDRWNLYIDKQLAKNPDAERFNIYYAYVWRFVMYSFQYPFIRKRATSQLKIFKVYKVLMWFNAFWIYSFIAVMILANIARYYGYIQF